MDELKYSIITSGLDPNDLKLELHQCISKYVLPTKNINRKPKYGYISKTKQTLQINFERQIFNVARKIHYISVSMHGHKVNNNKVKELRYGSIPMLHMLINCENLKNEKTRL